MGEIERNKARDGKQCRLYEKGDKEEKESCPTSGADFVATPRKAIKLR